MRPYDAVVVTSRDDHPWHSPAEPRRERADLLAPRTQIVADRDAYLGQGRHDVGRRISDEQVELFISGDVAGALQQEFTQHAPEFVALHDVGSSASLRLLGSLSGAAGARVQKLSVRRQGHGVALAVLQFVEVPLADGTPVRLYSTDLNSDNQTRALVARVLLAHSRLGALLVGELPPHAVTAQLAPLHDALVRGPWPNRDLLLVPLGSSTALATQATQLAGHSPVAVHVAPHADSPRDAWNYIGGAWNRLHGQPGGERALQTDLALAIPPRKLPSSEQATEVMGLDPVSALLAAAGAGPAAPAAVPNVQSVPNLSQAPHAPTTAHAQRHGHGHGHWQAYADRCLKIKGAVACCVFELQGAQPLALAGGPPGAGRLAQQGTAALTGLAESAHALGLQGAPAEATLSTATHHLLLRAVPGHPGTALILLLLASTGNLTLARMQLERTDPPPPPAPPTAR
jgi:hypothetical protein